MKKKQPAAMKQIKTTPKTQPMNEAAGKECKIFVLNTDDWNIHQDDRANIMNADFHQMDSARNSKRYS
ncbi:hypothetical protein [Maridesulfovibrio frigidus]|uniref:hypothetical protein n=1 Tax=Maridesulfovibrio frigidus TaxID=340956 RepID=UPI0004E0C5A4|nr:hypothetical protein [Maridesulfovibrio frigidus]